MSQQEQQDKSQYFYRASAADFMKIPGAPIAYWASEQELSFFESYPAISEYATSSNGVQTGNNGKYVRGWFEISHKEINGKWFPYNKGGAFRKWYGNYDFVVNWLDNGKDIKSEKNSCARGEEFYFSEGITWSDVTSGKLSCRYLPEGFIFDASGPSAFFGDKELTFVGLALMNTNFANYWSKILNPTLHFQSGDFRKITLSPCFINSDVIECAKELISLTRQDWDEFESSMGFSAHPLMKTITASLKHTYEDVCNVWDERIKSAFFFEQKNNNYFSSAYGIQTEQYSTINIGDITLNCNPYYRYGLNRNEDELATLLQCDTLQDFLSYVVGCMMGRYSIDKPGLILASQGETLQDYLHQIPNPRFMPDSDAILPLTDQEWFADDVTNRVREFVKVVWGEETLQENLAFIAESLCLHAIKPKKSEGALDTIRRYLSTQFYKDHLKTYKKRPIYWLFSSGKEKAFECLVYLHRYNESTLARMRTEYVTPLMGKYDAQHSLLLEQKTDASPAQQRELEKDIKALEKKQTELRAFDEQLKHYADMRIKLDLDDGVKVNYGKFGNLLAEVKAVTGDKGE
ncbi:BREX-1 system adenine-specific DNA-methyltransferase PglX [Alishewanella sp. HL-SH05]|uniref:BREX-1 system adenine-specific DNA-methyltransferase PglX n=1 Tax=Alishewanella sp. HL-SH05 TaxID=3461145 RepID=UPI004041DEAB